MEVLLKKTKITKSVFLQLRHVNIAVISLLKPLGFICIKEFGFLNRYYLVYDERTNDLYKCRPITEISKSKTTGGLPIHGVRIRSANASGTSYHDVQLPPDVDLDVFITELEATREIILKLGQIYI